MIELFDLIAGSETGAIIASSLALKNTEPEKANEFHFPGKYHTSKSLEWFQKNVDTLYRD